METICKALGLANPTPEQTTEMAKIAAQALLVPGYTNDTAILACLKLAGIDNPTTEEKQAAYNVYNVARNVQKFTDTMGKS